jgi:hypothetical protein
MCQSALFFVVLTFAYFLYLRRVKLSVFRRLWLVYLTAAVSLLLRLTLDTYTVVSYDYNGINGAKWVIYVLKIVFTVSEKLRTVLITLFLFDFRLVAIRLDSDTPQEYERKFSRYSIEKAVIISLTIAIFVYMIIDHSLMY